MNDEERSVKWNALSNWRWRRGFLLAVNAYKVTVFL